MTGLLRLIARAVWLTFELIVAAVGFCVRVRRVSAVQALGARALWLHRAARRALRVLGVSVESSGSMPEAGLLVCNHLGYLDILVLAAVGPCIFVSKRDVRDWPVFGAFAAMGGTLFVDRNSRADTIRTNARLAHVLARGVPVVLFPEGTSSDGASVLPFKSSLLEPVASGHHQITTAHLSYRMEVGDPARDVCYWGDMRFFPHLLRLLTHRSVHAAVRFAPFHQATRDRKELARELRQQILRMREARTGRFA